MIKFPSKLLGDEFPFRRMIQEGVVALDDGSVLAMLELEGRAWQTVDEEWVNAWKDRLNETNKNISTEQLVLMTYECHGLVERDEYQGGQFRSAFSESLDISYADQLFYHRMFRTRLFIAVQIRPFVYGTELMNEQRNQSRRRWWRHTAPKDSQIHMLGQVIELLLSELSEYQPRRLGTKQPVPGRLIENEIAEAFVYAMTNQWRKIGLTRGRMSEAMFRERPTFKNEIIRFWGPGYTDYAAMLGWKHYPAETWPLMFEKFRAKARYRYTICHYYRFLAKGVARELLTRRQNRGRAAGSRAVGQIKDLDQGLSDLESNKFVYGDHSMSVCVFSESTDGLLEATNAAWSHLADGGVTAVREDKGLEAAWFAMMPGNSHLRVRPGAANSENFASFAPLHNLPRGEPKGYWGQPLCMVRTAANTPYLFHLHVGDVGNVLVTGLTGSGKSTFLAFMLSQSEKLGAQAVVWDKDRGLEPLVRAMGGNYNAIGNPTWLSPLKALSNSPHDLNFLGAWIRSLIAGPKNYDLTQEEGRRLTIGLRTVMSLEPEHRSLMEIRAFLGSESREGAGPRLEKWCHGNELGWVADCPEDRIRLDAPVITFDQTKFLDDPVTRGPILAYLFHRAEALIDGRRLLFLIDEFWKALLDPAFQKLIHDKLKTLRKANSPVILATQSPEDALNSPIAHTITQQTPTCIYFSNTGATFDAYGPGGMGLNSTEFGIVKTLVPGSGMFLLKQNNQSVVCQLPLAGMDDELAVLSGRKQNINILDEIVPVIGENDPVRLMQEFHRRRKELVS